MEAYLWLVGPPSSGKFIKNTFIDGLEPIADSTLFLIQAELFFSLHLSLRRTQVLAIRAVRIVAVERFGIVGMVLRGGWWQCFKRNSCGSKEHRPSLLSQFVLPMRQQTPLCLWQHCGSQLAHTLGASEHGVKLEGFRAT